MANGDEDVLAGKVVDGLLAAHVRMPDPAALANTLIDFLHIASCGSFRLRLQRAGGPNEAPRLIPTGVRLGRHSLKLEALEGDGRAAPHRQAAIRIASIIALLEYRERELWDHVKPQFVEALSAGGAVEPPAVATASDALAPRLLERIAERIGQSAAEYERAGSPREVFLGTKPPRLRVLTVHRFFRGGIPFGRLVLAQSQVIPRQDGTDEGGTADSFVAPLAQFPRAVRQSFESGFALYGDWVDALSPGLSAAVNRAMGLKPDDPVPKACFIPCHVGGVAWTLSAIVNTRIDEGFAELCLRLYREWIPRVFEALRTSAQSDFQSWMLDCYQQGIAQPSADRTEINRGWASIRCCYPLPKWTIEAAQPDHNEPEFIRLPRIRGQDWAIAWKGTTNEYYRPPERLSQPASWGSGTLWGETLVHRMHEITSYISQSHDVQRLRATEEAVASWAHEVKGYTAPIISDLRLALRKTEEAAPAHDPLRRALHAALILNACSFAAQKILENRAAPSADTDIFRVPARNCQNIVEALLQFLLQYWRSASPRRLILVWDGELSERDALGLLADSLGTRRSGCDPAINEDLLTHPAVIGVICLLREVVFNIKCRAAVAEPIVSIGRQIVVEPNRLKLRLEQKQEERYPWSSNPEPPKGLQRANRLYGPEGAQLGQIVCSPPEQARTAKGVSITYTVEVTFNLAP